MGTKVRQGDGSDGKVIATIDGQKVRGGDGSYGKVIATTEGGLASGAAAAAFLLLMQWLSKTRAIVEQPFAVTVRCAARRLPSHAKTRPTANFLALAPFRHDGWFKPWKPVSLSSYA